MRFPLRPYIAHMQAQQHLQQRKEGSHEPPAPLSPFIGPMVHHMTLLDGELVQDKMEEGKVSCYHYTCFIITIIMVIIII